MTSIDLMHAGDSIRSLVVYSGETSRGEIGIGVGDDLHDAAVAHERGEAIVWLVAQVLSGPSCRSKSGSNA